MNQALDYILGDGQYEALKKCRKHGLAEMLYSTGDSKRNVGTSKKCMMDKHGEKRDQYEKTRDVVPRCRY